MRTSISAVLLFAVCVGALRPTPGGATRRGRVCRANPFDEVLDALDSLVGVSPLSEADLKDSSGVDLQRRAEAKERSAPPPDALEKPSVSVFFGLLGLFPVLLMVAGLANGAKPFGL